MARLPGINHQQAVRALEKVGFQIIRHGKHIVMSDGERIIPIGKRPLNHKFVLNEKTPQSDFANPRHVIITVEKNEDGWKDGYYYSPSIRIQNVKRLFKSD